MDNFGSGELTESGKGGSGLFSGVFPDRNAASFSVLILFSVEAAKDGISKEVFVPLKDFENLRARRVCLVELDIFVEQVPKILFLEPFLGPRSSCTAGNHCLNVTR